MQHQFKSDSAQHARWAIMYITYTTTLRAIRRLGGGGAQQWATVVNVVATMPVEIVALPLALGSVGVELFTSPFALWRL
eukprot:8848129-Pyramimonas_sp.AAC.1